MVHADIRMNPDTMKALFDAHDEELSALKIEELFPPTFSPEGSNKRRSDVTAHSHWRELLQTLESKKI